jgi:hypothetical protein
MSRLMKHFTYANVMSTLCLFLLLGAGAAHAAGVGRNTVGSPQIIDGQVKTVDLDDSAVKGSKVAPNTLTGADVAEATLAGVNAAKVGGLTVKRISWNVPHGTSSQSIVTFPGEFRIDASCNNTGDHVDIAAFTGENASDIRAYSINFLDADDTDGQRDIASTTDLLFTNEGFPVDNVLPTGAGEDITIDFYAPSGFVVHAELATTEYFGASEGCLISGYAIGG